MAVTTVATDASSVATKIQNDIYLQNIIPLAYATPQITMFDTEPLKKRGKTLQKDYLVEQSEMASLASYEVTTIAENDTIGVEEIKFGTKTFTVGKYGKSHVITDLSKYYAIGDLTDASALALRSVAARTINSLVYDALLAATGLMWLREDGDTTAQKAGLLVDSGTTTTIVCDELTEANDFWNGAQVIFESGKMAGQGYLVSDWVLSTTTLTVGTMPFAPAANDKFRICGVGNTDTATLSAISTSDTPTLRAILKSAARSRHYGAASIMAAGGPNVQYDRAGIRRQVSPSISSGVIFLEDYLLETLLDSLSSTDVQANQALWQSDEGFSRIVGGGLRRMGNMLWVPVNHHKRKSTADGTLSNTAGGAWPVLGMFKGCALATTLRDNTGDKVGLVYNTKIPSRNDIANKYDSIKMINENYMFNAFGAQNGLHGFVHWCYTSMT